MKRHNTRAFTLIELIMVILLLAILGAIAIPNFIDFRSDARNAATQGALGAMRSALSIAVSAVALKEGTGTPKYPTAVEFAANAFNASHPVLTGTPILESSAGIPKNPWSTSTATDAEAKAINACAVAKGTLLAAPNPVDRGWCYNATTGEVWANSDLNSGGAATENTY